jgi:hypothetical protein
MISGAINAFSFGYLKVNDNDEAERKLQAVIKEKNDLQNQLSSFQSKRANMWFLATFTVQMMFFYFLAELYFHRNDPYESITKLIYGVMGTVIVYIALVVFILLDWTAANALDALDFSRKLVIFPFYTLKYVSSFFFPRKSTEEKSQ